MGSLPTQYARVGGISNVAGTKSGRGQCSTIVIVLVGTLVSEKTPFAVTSTFTPGCEQTKQLLHLTLAFPSQPRDSCIRLEHNSVMHCTSFQAFTVSIQRKTTRAGSCRARSSARLLIGTKCRTVASRRSVEKGTFLKQKLSIGSGARDISHARGETRSCALVRADQP